MRRPRASKRSWKQIAANANLPTTRALERRLSRRVLSRYGGRTDPSSHSVRGVQAARRLPHQNTHQQQACAKSAAEPPGNNLSTTRTLDFPNISHLFTI